MPGAGICLSNHLPEQLVVQKHPAPLVLQRGKEGDLALPAQRFGPRSLQGFPGPLCLLPALLGRFPLSWSLLLQPLSALWDRYSGLPLTLVSAPLCSIFPAKL